MKPVKLLLMGFGLLAVGLVLFTLLRDRPSSHPGLKSVFGRDAGAINVQRFGPLHVEFTVTDLPVGGARARLRDRFEIQGGI